MSDQLDEGRRDVKIAEAKAAEAKAERELAAGELARVVAENESLRTALTGALSFVKEMISVATGMEEALEAKAWALSEMAADRDEVTETNGHRL